MPEGPEVWALERALTYYLSNTDNSETFVSYGKHLLLVEAKEDWSFGLNGTVHIDSNKKLTKLNSGYIPGGIEYNVDINSIVNNNNVVNWLSATEEELVAMVNKHFAKSKKMLGPLLLDQNIIAGIGVAWGSEILGMAGLYPNVKAYQQNLSNLANIMFTIGNEIKRLYNWYILERDALGLDLFINTWFRNLYSIRKMSFYKKGKQIEVSGRTWYVKHVLLEEV